MFKKIKTEIEKAAAQGGGSFSIFYEQKLSKNKKPYFLISLEYCQRGKKKTKALKRIEFYNLDRLNLSLEQFEEIIKTFKENENQYNYESSIRD